MNSEASGRERIRSGREQRAARLAADRAARGRVCQLGFLGGLEPVTDFNLISDLPTSVQLSFYGSAFVLGTEGFPLAEIPLADMIAKAEAGRYKAKPIRVFGFGQIVEAHRAMEEGAAGGKMVVAVS
jgi:NADPH:quinone reductase-like Zn-dependent oxidoreductase